MAEFQEKCVSVYEELSKAPSIDSITVSCNNDNILYWDANWSQRDISRNTKVCFRTNGFLNNKDETLNNVKSPTATEMNGEKLACVSNCGKLRAVLREKEIKNDKHYFLEVWKNSQKTCCIDLTQQEKHGVVHANSLFGCLEWSHSNDKIAYIAEKKLSKSKSFFAKSSSSSDSKEETIYGREYEYKEDWGEQLLQCRNPSLFVYDIKSGEITDMSSHLPANVSVSKALWSADDSNMFVLGWHASPHRIGLIYCKNRYSTLYQLHLQSSRLTCLTDGKSCVYSPLLNPDYSYLIYLETIPFGPHAQCSKMMCIEVSDDAPKTPRVVVDIVNKSEDPASFQGLFVDAIPKNCWLSNGHQLVLHSIHRSNVALLCIDIKPITANNVTVIESIEAWNLLNVTNDILFVSYSAPNSPPILKAGRFNSDKINWLVLDSPFPTIEGIKWSIRKHEPTKLNSEYPDVDFESILIEPTDNKQSLGLIVNPHGGPHSCFVCGFDLFSAAFCKLGFTVLRINYRGSLGFGQNGVFSLPKHVSSQDVSDVHQAAEATLKDNGLFGDNIYVFGGSHGGFLTLHMVGQYPNLFAAGATRNPVTNLLSMISVTDIPDWCFCEGGSTYSYDALPDSDLVSKLMSCSPIAHVSRVKAPLLFLIGAVDARVPSSQSLEYIQLLKGLGKKVDVLYYEGNNHPIAHVDAEADCFVNTAKWFFEHNLNNK